MVTTYDRSYAFPVRPKVTFKSLDGATTYFTFDAFADDNDLPITYMDCEGAVGESGSFNIVIQDSQNLIEQANLRSCKVYIRLGKTSTTMHYFMIGFADIFTTGRPVTGYKEYRLTGFGSAIQASQLYIHKRKASKIQNIDDPTTAGNIEYNANRLVKDAIESKNWRPLKDESIKDITNWLTTGISSKVNINIPVINAPFTYLSNFLDQICNITGAVWFVDFTSGTEVFTLSYNNDLHTNVRIKSGDLRTISDDATQTGYIKGGFNVEDNSTNEAGVATRLYTATIINQTTVSSSFTNQGSSTLDFKALAQQLILDNDSRRLDSLAFILSKVGAPESPESVVRGTILLDNGANKPANNSVLGNFSIDLSSINEQPETIFVNDINIKESMLGSGQTKIWLVLFQRSGITGNPTHDPANTIRWHHSGVFNSSPVLTTYSGSAEEGDRDKRSSLAWNTTNLGPTYTYSVFSNIKRLQARTNQGAANILRMREVFLPTEFITDQRTINRYLSLILSQMSKPRRSIPDYRVTVPNNFIFKPYQWVSFNDGLSDIFQDLQIQRVRYVIGSQTGDAQIGTLHAEISLGGSFNPLTENCSCG